MKKWQTQLSNNPFGIFFVNSAPLKHTFTKMALSRAVSDSSKNQLF